MSRTAPATGVTKPAVAVLISAVVLTAVLTVNVLVNFSLADTVESLPFYFAYVTVPGLVGVMAAAATRRFARWQQWLTAMVAVLLAMFAMGWLVPPLYPLETERTFGGGMIVVIYAGPVYVVVTAVVAAVMAVLARVRAQRISETQLSR